MTARAAMLASLWACSPAPSKPGSDGARIVAPRFATAYPSSLVISTWSSPRSGDVTSPYHEDNWGQMTGMAPASAIAIDSDVALSVAHAFVLPSGIRVARVKAFGAAVPHSGANVYATKGLKYVESPAENIRIAPGFSQPPGKVITVNRPYWVHDVALIFLSTPLTLTLRQVPTIEHGPEHEAFSKISNTSPDQVTAGASPETSAEQEAVKNACAEARGSLSEDDSCLSGQRYVVLGASDAQCDIDGAPRVSPVFFDESIHRQEGSAWRTIPFVASSGDSGGGFVKIGWGYWNDRTPSMTNIALLGLLQGGPADFTANYVTPLDEPWVYCGIYNTVIEYRRATGKQGLGGANAFLPYLTKLPVICAKYTHTFTRYADVPMVRR